MDVTNLRYYVHLFCFYKLEGILLESIPLTTARE